jgi:glycosyltransferase involved in cell wall biosynthesis
MREQAPHHQDRLRILAFEAYDAGSHQQVRELICRYSRHRWTWLTRPGRAWKWRMRLGAVELAEQAIRLMREVEPEERQESNHSPFDAVFATSLLSVADLRAVLSAELRKRPFLVYMHENQLAYPPGERGVDPRDVHFGLTNLTSVLAADHVLWNSHWNLESFLSGIRELLRHAPDLVLDEDALAERIRAKSAVVWPPVETPPANAASGGEAGRVLHNTSAPQRVVWPHRWEHDKGPDELLEVAREVRRQGVALRWTILGWSHETQRPPAMDAFLEEFADDIDHAGYANDRAGYWRHLRRSDWVLSTAKHEFFGIAVVEALLAGCLPWLPDRLSYPEILPDCARGLSPMNPPEDADAVREAIEEHLAPARAERAVARLDEVVEQLATAP